VENWRVLDFTTFEGTIAYERGRIVAIKDDGTEREVPLADVGSILLGTGVGLAPGVLHGLARFDVVVLPADWRGVPQSGVYPWSTHTRVGARQLAQAELSAPRRKNAWGRIVKAKVAGQAANLRLLRRPAAAKVAGLVGAVRSGDPDNIEAHAARAYWPQVFGDAEFSREPGLAVGRNALLNYGYMVLRSHAVRAIISAGLTPALGVFHRGRSNPFNLADDLMEPFRPAVDWVVAGLPAEATLEDPEVKAKLVFASQRQAFSPQGYAASSELTDLAQQFGRYVEGDVEKLQVPRWEGPQGRDDDGA
jgi:CRISPR-associated protein Cas1